MELAELKQKPDDTLNTYYSRALNLMQKYGAKDRSAGRILSLAESSLLDTFLRQWVRGLTDPKVKQKAAEGIAALDASLRKVYTLATEARRANLELAKLLEDESKENDLIFYKSVAERNLSPAQIETMRASYQSGNTQNFAPINRPMSAPPARQPEQTKPAQQRPILQDTTRGNSIPQRSDQRSSNPYQSGTKRNYQGVPKDLPDAKTSKNPYINGLKTWLRSDGPLCFKCGHLGHVAKECLEHILPAWEQSYLKTIIFGEATPHANFAAACYGAFDGALKPYHDNHHDHSHDHDPGRVNHVLLPSSNSISLGLQGLALSKVSITSDSAVPTISTFVDSMFDETSGPNKRARDEDPSTQETVRQPPQPRPFEQQQTQQTPFQFQPTQPQRNQPFQPQPFQPPPGTDGRAKKKGTKKVGKKTEPQPLIGMFNEAAGKYEAAISIRDMMKQHRLDISLMDFVAWSPQACKELKRMCTRVAKKREKK